MVGWYWRSLSDDLRVVGPDPDILDGAVHADDFQHGAFDVHVLDLDHQQYPVACLLHDLRERGDLLAVGPA